jgi:hypothetical protein
MADDVVNFLDEVPDREAIRAWVRGYLAAPHVMGEADPLRRRFNALVGGCLVADEVELAWALTTLVALRCAGLQSDAAATLLALANLREAIESGARVSLTFHVKPREGQGVGDAQ